jgi:phage major head subunit gpT-like protein
MGVPSINTIDINTFRAPFQNTYEGSVNGLWFKDVAKIYPTNSMTGVYPGLASAVGMKAWTSSRQGQKPLPFKLTLTSAPYEASVIYPVDNFNVDTIGIFQDNIMDMATKAAWHYNWMVRDLLAVGHSTASFDSNYDGSTAVNFFSTGHPYGFDATGANPSGTQSNLLTSTTAGVGTSSLAVVLKTAPTPLECAKIIQDITAAFLGMFDLNGDQINGTARNFNIIVGDAAKYSAFLAAVTQLTVVSNTSGSVVTNPIVGLQSNGFKYNVLFEPVLTGDSIYVLRTDGFVKPILIQETSGIQIQTMGPGSEYSITNNNVLFGVKKTCAVGPLLYTSALKATLVTHA